MDAHWAWGLLVLAAGIFVCSYGNMLFRFALAATGFGIGFLASMRLLEGQSDLITIVVSLAIGGALAMLLFALVKFTLYVAGAVLGIVTGSVLASALILLDLDVSRTVTIIFAIAGMAIGTFFGKMLGDWVILLASSAAGAFLIINGLVVLYSDRLVSDELDKELVAATAQQVGITVFFAIFAVSFLAQNNYRQLRRGITA
jgi:hypothetical protein